MRTSAATEKVMAAKDERIAERLRSRGWVVFSPALVATMGSVPVVLSDEPYVCRCDEAEGLSGCVVHGV